MRPDEGRRVAYEPIENYGVIGNMRTAALVGKHGSIDWYCVPHFDSPSVFAAILDDEQGGRFEIAPVGNGAATKQLYWPETNVLVTRFLSPDGVGEIEDFMPVGGGGTNDWRDHLIRRVRVVRGCLKFRHAVPSGVRLRAGEARDGDRPGERRRFPLAGVEPPARHRGSAAGGRPRGLRRVHAARGGEGDLRDPSDREGEPARRAPLGGPDGGAVQGDGRLLAPLDLGLHLPRPLAGDGAPLGAGAQAADLRADRGDRGGADLQPARASRRRAQLGLPLHLAARRRVHHLRPAAHRLHRRGLAVHELARRPLHGGRRATRGCRSSTASTAGRT